MEEIIVPWRVPRDRVEPAKQVRSTLINGSLRSLRLRGLETEYFARLPKPYADEIRALVPGVWVPVEVAIAHYTALDGIPLSHDERVAYGGEVSAHIQASFLGTVAKMATGMGVTPWTGLAQAERLWDRLAVGGAVQVVKVGPKEARFEAAGLALLGIGHFRVGFRGFVCAGCELFARKVYGVDIARLCSASTVGYRLSWV